MCVPGESTLKVSRVVEGTRQQKETPSVKDKIDEEPSRERTPSVNTFKLLSIIIINATSANVGTRFDYNYVYVCIYAYVEAYASLCLCLD